MGLGALAVVRLVRALQRRASSRRSRAARSRGPRGRRKPTSVRLGSPSFATRSGPRTHVWGKPPRPLVAQGRRCYVARLARRRPVDGLPREDPGRPCVPRLRRSPHLWTLLWTTPATADAPGSATPGGPQRCGRERNGELLTADDIWDQGSATLRDQLAPATWAAWFHGVRPLTYDGDSLLLSVPSSLAAERIRSSYSGMLTDAIRDSTGVTVRVELLVETDPKVRESIALAPPPVAVVVDEHDLDPMHGRDPGRRRRRARPTAPGRRARSTPATPSTSSSSARRTASRTRPRSRSPRAPAAPTTRCSSTAPPGWARPTSCTRSATTCARSSATSGCGTCPPSRS